jgi:hypothetical protein
LVNGALKEEIAAIHAWTPKCYTPEEWERKRAVEGTGMPQGFEDASVESGGYGHWVGLKTSQYWNRHCNRPSERRYKGRELQD